MKSIIRKKDLTDGKVEWFFLTFIFLMAFLYFFFSGKHVLFFQEQQSLFVYSSLYLQEFLVRPGGLLDLAGKFLTQFYFSRLAGALIVAIIITIPGWILLKVNKHLSPGSEFSAPLMIVPSCLLLLMQTHYYHMILYNLGYLFVLFYFLGFLFSGKKVSRVILLVLFPVFFYFTGAYAVIFAGLLLLYSLIYLKGPEKFCLPLILITEALVSAFLFRKILLVQSYKQLVLFPLPFINDQIHKIFFWVLTVFIMLYPVILRLAGSFRSLSLKTGLLRIIIPAIIVIVTVVLLVTGYNIQNAKVINLEKLIFTEQWDEAIDYQEKDPSKNLIGQYFYNIALSETGQLCDRLFRGRQDFGTGSLILPWSSEYLNWGATVFYTTGLINEAGRWAYEEMVVYGLRPQNMKMLVKTSLLTGNYRLTEKYTGILKKSLFYRGWARRYEKMSKDTSLIRLDQELSDRLKMVPRSDFFIYLESPEANLPLLVDENPKNRRAFEYMMSWLMLGREVDILANNIRLMKNMGYSRIPRHIEEAILIYYNSRHKFPDMGGLTLSNETRMRFDQYFSAYVTARNNPSTLEERMREQFRDTFWYYFHFK